MRCKQIHKCEGLYRENGYYLYKQPEQIPPRGWREAFLKRRHLFYSLVGIESRILNNFAQAYHPLII